MVFSVAELSKRSFYSVREHNVIETILALDPNVYFCSIDGEIVPDFCQRFRDLPDDAIFQVHFRLLGGKGGFGSLLRSFRVNKSTNQLMCRDLNGRRLASIDEEQKLKKWIERAAEREREKIAKRNAKYQKLKSGPPKHMFNDPDYIRQKETIIEKTEEAFEQGFVEFMKEEQEKKASRPVESSSDSDFDIDDLPGGSKSGRKRKGPKLGAVVTEKALKLDEENDSDSDSEENDVDPELIFELQEYFSGKDPKPESSKTKEPCGSKDDKVKEAEDLLPQQEQTKTTSEKAATGPEKGGDVVERTKTTAEEGVTDSAECTGLEKRAKTTPQKGVVESEEFAEVDLTQYKSAAELEALGLKHLKHALLARGMKCGGTLSERAARLFSAKERTK